LVPDSDSVLISDGGLATELEARCNDLSDPRMLPVRPSDIAASAQRC
jgi:S-methylmethionine-dependent homocysteine/selenocysteine methylase